METEDRGDSSTDLVERAVAIIQRTNGCDARAAREILSSTAQRNRLDEADVARTLVALSATTRRASRPLY